MKEAPLLFYHLWACVQKRTILPNSVDPVQAQNCQLDLTLALDL
jgi:hypothetical protein